MVLGDASQQLCAFLSHPWTFFLLGLGLGLYIKMGWGIQIFWPHNSPLKILLSGPSDGEEGFDVFGLPHRLVKSCHLLAFRAFSFAYDTFLAIQYPERVSIKFWWLYTPHVGRCDGNLTAGIPPAFMSAKNRAVTLIGSINTHSNGPVILLLHPIALAHIP